MSAQEGVIFNIQRFSVKDGPGIRTTVFFKGCNLRCRWCHNPESLTSGMSLEFNSEKCILCRRCAEVCPTGAHVFVENQHLLRREKCTVCGRCAGECFAEALTVAGQTVTVDQLMREILTDEMYFTRSGGGVTFSGGECMLQIDFLDEIVRRCRERGISVAIDTAGNVPWESLEKMAVQDVLFLYDMKAVSGDVHTALTGVGNARILMNLSRLLERHARIRIRVPVIPGGNWTEMAAIAQWLSGKEVEMVELLPYHRLGEGKRTLLGEAAADGFRVPEKAEMDQVQALFAHNGVDAVQS